MALRREEKVCEGLFDGIELRTRVSMAAVMWLILRQVFAKGSLVGNNLPLDLGILIRLVELQY